MNEAHPLWLDRIISWMLLQSSVNCQWIFSSNNFAIKFHLCDNFKTIIAKYFALTRSLCECNYKNGIVSKNFAPIKWVHNDFKMHCVQRFLSRFSRCWNEIILCRHGWFFLRCENLRTKNGNESCEIKSLKPSHLNSFCTFFIISDKRNEM